MPFAAFDLHKKFIQATTFDDLGNPVHSERFPATRPAIQAFAARHLTPRHQVALEATFNTWEIAAILQPLVGEVVVSNPQRTRAIAQAKVKTDKIDTHVLGHLLHCGYLPRVWIPPEPIRRLRQECTERANLTQEFAIRRLNAYFKCEVSGARATGRSGNRFNAATLRTNRNHCSSTHPLHRPE